MRPFAVREPSLMGTAAGRLRHPGLRIESCDRGGQVGGARRGIRGYDDVVSDSGCPSKGQRTATTSLITLTVIAVFPPPPGRPGRSPAVSKGNQHQKGKRHHEGDHGDSDSERTNRIRPEEEQ